MTDAEMIRAYMREALRRDSLFLSIVAEYPAESPDALLAEYHDRGGLVCADRDDIAAVVGVVGVIPERVPIAA